MDGTRKRPDEYQGVSGRDISDEIPASCEDEDVTAYHCVVAGRRNAEKESNVGSNFAKSPEPSPLSPRAELVQSLTNAISAAVAAGDLQVARVAHEALGRLIADGNSAVVVDLATERAKRRGTGDR